MYSRGLASSKRSCSFRGAINLLPFQRVAHAGYILFREGKVVDNQTAAVTQPPLDGRSLRRRKVRCCPVNGLSVIRERLAMPG
ncbi:hypothetical protein AHiyo4_01000 [Arthrobacter sp. Hiyo4]|nr:hypothetical protein AHiyo4_01000 [Arthrobacter sp. Hiyo4]